MTLYTGDANGSLTLNPLGTDPGLTEVTLPGAPWGGDLVLSVLWGPADQRGANIVVPYLDGAIATPKRPAETTRDLRFTITGECDLDGVAADDPLEQLEVNIDFLTANVGDPPPSGVTRTALLTMPSGAQRRAEVQTQLLLGAQSDYFMPAVLRLIVPGWFVAVEPP